MRPDPTQRDAWRHRELPPVAEIAPGVWAVPVPCEIFPVRFTYSYVIADGANALVIDPGLDSDLGWTHLSAGLSHAGLEAKSITGIVITHFHPDHLGMARRLQEASGAWVGAHAVEIEHVARWFASASEDAGAKEAEWLTATSSDVELLGGAPSARMVELMQRQMMLPERVLHDGDVISVSGRHLQVVHTPGHTAGHICLIDERGRLIFTGDHVLPTINPNVGLHPGMLGDDPIGEYLGALDRLRPFSEYMTLPAHEYAFDGLGHRLDALRGHHEDRSRQVLRALDRGNLSVWEIAMELAWSRKWDDFHPTDRRLAVATTFAQVRFLERQGLVVERDGAPGRYELAAA